jgi:hypothetical protein
MVAEIGWHDWRHRKVRECRCSWGAMRREAMFGPVLTHWDEAAAYAVIGRLVSALFWRNFQPPSDLYTALMK